MSRFVAVAAVFFGLLLLGATLEIAHAHTHDGAIAESASSHHEHEHDRTDHSHEPGEDLVHELIFHGCVSAAGLIESEIVLPAVRAHAVPIALVALPHGITSSPPDRPPSC